MTLPMDTDAITPLICQISRWSMRFVGREMSRLGFGPGQFFFLAELFRADGLSQDELSRRVGVDKSNTSRVLARLETINKNAAKIFLEQGDIEPPVTDDQNELKWKRNGRSRKVC